MLIAAAMQEKPCSKSHGSPMVSDGISVHLDDPGDVFLRHRLVEMGQHILGKEPSSWFGPTSAAQAVGHLFETSKEVETRPRVR